MIITQDYINQLRAMAQASSAAAIGPLTVGTLADDIDPVEWFRKNLSHGNGQVYCVMLPQKHETGDYLITAITGNGPTSEANAELYAQAIRAILALISEREKLHDCLREMLTAGLHRVGESNTLAQLDAERTAAEMRARALLGDESVCLEDEKP